MKSGANTLGFTIVEVMIFLAVSGILMISTLTVISGTQNKAEFNQSINDIKQQIDTVVNNVANGYYTAGDDIMCSDDGTNLTIQTGGSRGMNADCIFIGRVIDFSTSDQTFTIYDVAGARQKSGKEVTTMSQARPVVINGSGQLINVKNGVKRAPGKSGMRVINGGTSNAVSSVGFFNTFGKTILPTSDLLESRSQQSDFMGFQMPSSGVLPSSLGSTYDAKKNPDGGVVLCFESGGTDQHANITIGGGGRSATTSMEVAGGGCPNVV